MPKVVEVCRAGRTLDCYARHSSRYGRKGTPRSENINATPLPVKLANQRKSVRHLRRLINHNFRPGDYHLVLGYKPEARPETQEEAVRQIRGFLRKVRREFRKQEQALRYVWVLERGKRGALHVHMVISQTAVEILQKAWPYGRPQIYPLDESWNWSALAEYLIKRGAAQEGKRYNPSRTLVEPETERWISGEDIEEPEAEAGYTIDRDTVNFWITDEGYLSLEYVQVKVTGG